MSNQRAVSAAAPNDLTAGDALQQLECCGVVKYLLNTALVMER